MTVLPVKDGAVFSPGFAGDGEICAGKKIEYPKMKVYIGKEKNGKYYYEQKKSKTNYVNTVTFPQNGVKSYLNKHSCYFNPCYLYLIKMQKCSYRKDSTPFLMCIYSTYDFYPF